MNLQKSFAFVLCFSVIGILSPLSTLSTVGLNENSQTNLSTNIEDKNFVQSFTL